MTLPQVDLPAVPPPHPPGAPRFAPGDAVRVKTGSAPGHIRTPWYLRGKTGRVERVCGAFGNPEELAYGRKGPPLPLYRVRFAMREIWGEAAERADGSAPDSAPDSDADSVDAEIFEHWLEAA